LAGRLSHRGPLLRDLAAGNSATSAAPLSIFAVQAKICARKDDAATRAVRTKIRSNGDVANGATVGLAASYTYLSDILVWHRPGWRRPWSRCWPRGPRAAHLARPAPAWSPS
jgi:hypothetical protein